MALEHTLLPSAHSTVNRKATSVREPSDVTRAIATGLVAPAEGDQTNQRIASILQDVPDGILRALWRHGVSISVGKNDWIYDPRTGRINIRAEVLHGPKGALQLKTALGWAFNHLLLADFVERQGGKNTDVRWLLSDVAQRRHALRDADRLVDCWQNGDTLSAYATTGIGEMFAAGFAAFCTPIEREEFRRRAPGLFELVSEFADRYVHGPLQQQGVHVLPADATGLGDARTFARKMLIGSHSAQQREEVAQFLRYAPPQLLPLLHGHGVRICVELGVDPSTYNPKTRRVTLRVMDRGTLLHELGHALDHVACIETVKHDIGVPENTNLSLLTDLGLNFPGRYALADALAARWHKGQKVSDYAEKHIREWFAESFKCSRDAGAADHLRACAWFVGDGTRATLLARDPQFVQLLDTLLSRLHGGIDINELAELAGDSPTEPKMRYKKGQSADGLELRDARAVLRLKAEVATKFVAVLVILATFPWCFSVLAGVVGTAIGVTMSAAIGAGVGAGVAVITCTGYAILFQGEYSRRLRQVPLAKAKVLGRRGTDWIVARRADGTIIDVDRQLFSGLADAPKVDESIALNATDGTLHALTERQMTPQTKGSRLSRATARGRNTDNTEIHALPILALSAARDLDAKNVTGIFRGYGARGTMYIRVGAHTYKVDGARVHRVGRLKRGDTITLVRDGTSSWRLLGQDRLNLAAEVRAGLALRKCQPRQKQPSGRQSAGPLLSPGL